MNVVNDVNTAEIAMIHAVRPKQQVWTALGRYLESRGQFITAYQ